MPLTGCCALASCWQVEEGYLGSVALYLRPAVFEVNESIHMDKLTVITRGQVCTARAL